MRKIDIHCHLLPGIDDGAKDLEMAVKMARVAVDSGTVEMVVTPHHNNGVFWNERAHVLEQIQELQKTLDGESINLKLHPGSELHLMPELIQEVSYDHVLTNADRGKSVLIELPKQNIPVGAKRIMSELIALGLTPVIAHPERNAEILNNPKIYEQWIESGCRGQVTAMSVTGDFGGAIKSVCHRWLKKGYVHFIASDAHRPKGRSPDLSSCYDYVVDEYSEELADLLFYENPARLVNGHEIPSMHSNSGGGVFVKIKTIFGVHQ